MAAHKEIPAGNLKSEVIGKSIKRQIKPNRKFRNNFTASGRWSLTLKIQYNAQKMELPVARNTPGKLVCLKPARLPCEESTTIPARLIPRAENCCHVIFCFRRKTEKTARVKGQIILRGCASCAGNKAYDLKRTR